MSTVRCQQQMFAVGAAEEALNKAIAENEPPKVIAALQAAANEAILAAVRCLSTPVPPIKRIQE
jgi:hypothetical protein